ncbi:MAG: DUF1049 domain-containing protein [Methyloprofundus sp.]|nr:DUF1049 domain-containing protein [Methyloprofundus sp.]
MTRVLVFIFFTFIAVLVVIFSLRNFQPVDIDLYLTTIQMPLALALTIELFAGILIGFLAAFAYVLKLKSQYRALDREFKTKSQE